MRFLGLIPARGGSKRLPGKNLLKIGERSLVEIAMDNAKASGVLWDIAVSTDSVEIGELAAKHHCGPHWRSAEEAADDTPMQVVVDAAMRDYPAANVIDGVILLQPTSPLRTVEDIKNAADALERGWEAVVSVVACQPDAEEVFFRGESGRLVRIYMVDRVKPSGAIFGIRTSALKRGLTWWTAKTYAMHVSRLTSVDIDTQADLDEARALWRT